MVKIPFSVYDIFAYIVAGFWPILAFHVAFQLPPVSPSVGPIEGFALLSGSYIVGHLVASVSSFFLETVVVHKLMQPPSKWLVEKKRGLLRRIFPGYFTPLSNSVIERVTTKKETRNSTASGEELFALARFDPAVRGDEKVMERLNIFLVQYGFARNMTMSGLLVAGVFFAGYFVQACRSDFLLYGGVSAVLAVGMFYRYLKFFRQYSYELFNTWSQL